jgi:hypothetical protein
MSNISQLMLQIVYTPREDSNDRGYEDWLREIDTPFFNSVEGILHYSNWKITDSPVGTCPFTHFDLLFVDPDVGFDAIFEKQDVVEFASGWNDLWGTHPEGTFADSGVEIYQCKVIAEPAKTTRTSHVAFISNTPRDDAHDRGYDDWLRDVDNPFLNNIPAILSYTNWRVEGAVVGSAPYTDYDLMDIVGPEGWDAMVADDDMREFALGWIEQWGRAPDGEMDENFQVNIAEVIATPDE